MEKIYTFFCPKLPYTPYTPYIPTPLHVSMVQGIATCPCVCCMLWQVVSGEDTDGPGGIALPGVVVVREERAAARQMLRGINK